MILQQPDAISLSGNIKDLIISSSEEQEVVIQLNGDTVYSGKYVPDTDNKITVKLDNIITDLLVVPAPNADSITEKDIDNIIIAAGDDRSGFLCVKGGVAGSVSAATFLRANFLTWQPQTLKTYINAPLYIRYASLDEYILNVSGYFSDGTNETKVLYNCATNKIYTFNVSFQIITEKFGKTPAYFDLWIANSSGNKISFTQRYALANSGVNDDLFLFENTIGGIDTICFSGIKREATEVEILSATQNNDITIDYDIDFSRAYTKNIGYFPIKLLRGWVTEFFRSMQKYHVTENGISAIVISEPNIESEKYLPSSYSFTFAYSKEEKYLNYPRLEAPPEVVEIVDPEGTVFPLAPRLYEFPLADVGADPLIPVQHPFTDKWRYLPVSAIGGSSGSGGETSSIEIIPTGSSATPTDKNVFSAARSLNEFHPKGGDAGLDIEAKDSKVHGDQTVGGDSTVRGTATSLNAVVQQLAEMYDLDVSHVATLFNTVIKNQLSSENYISGLTGEGMKLWQAINGDWNLEIDNVTIRKAFYVFEMIVQKVRSVNGALAVTQGNGTIKSVSETTGGPAHYVCEIEGDMTFEEDDFVRCQVFSSIRLKYYWVKVYSVSGNSILLKKSDFTMDIPEAGDEIVQIGNEKNTARQGVLYLSAAEDGKPRFSVLDGVNSPSFAGRTKAVVGYIGDIIDSRFPSDKQPTGYGIYCDNAFLSGIFVLSSGVTLEDKLTSIDTQISAVPGMIQTSVTEEVSKINVDVQNLLVYGDFEQGDITSYGSVTGTSASYDAFTARTKDFIAISGTSIVKNEFNGTHNIGLFFYDANKTFISNNYDFDYPVSITIPANARYMKAWVRRASDTVGVSRPYQDIIRDAKVMISYGTQPVSWSVSPQDIASGYYTQIGGRNLLRNSKGVSDTPYSHTIGYTAAYRALTRTLEAGETVVFSYSGVTSNSVVGFTLYNTGEAPTETFPANTPVTLTKSYAHFRVRVSSSAAFAVDYMKLESGTKATDWTPAPEDVQSELDGKVSLTVYNTGITQLSNQISLKASRTDLDALGNRVSAAESEILLMPDKITLAVNNIQIGGRNLVLQSNQIFTARISTKTYNMSKTWLSLKGKTVAISFDYSYTNATTNSSNHILWFEQALATDSGTSYALSRGISLPITTSPISGSGRYKGTAVVPSNILSTSTTQTAVLIIKMTGGSGTITNFKIEEGNKSTDWTPAPEDVSDDLRRTGIDIESGTITLDANKTVITGSLIVKGIQNGGINVGGNCIITSTGLITAKGATIEGKITATSGSIGGVNISDKFIGIASDSTTAVGSYFAANYFGLRNNANYFRVDMSGQSGNSALQCTIDKTTDTTAALHIRNATASTGSIGAMAIYAFGRNELLGGVQVISGSATITDDSKPKIEVTSTDLKVTLRVNNTGTYITGYLRITTFPASGGAATVQFIRD